MKIKKKVSDVFIGSLLSNIFGKGYSFLIALKWSFEKKIEKP